MARIQILELPTIYRDEGPDETPFVLIVDQTEPQRIVLGVDAPWRDYWQDIADKIGARAAIVTPETIDIPANWVHTDDGVAGTVRIKVEPDLDGFSEQVEQEIRYAQGKVTRTLKGTDTALAALVLDTLGINIANPGPNEAPDYPAILATACRELQKSEGARTFLLRHKVALTDALGMDRLRDWDDIRNAAAGLRKERDAQADELERLRAGEEPVTDKGVIPTPGQWIWEWNRAATEKRLSMAAQILDSMSRANNCFMADHEAQIASLRAEVERLRTETPDA